VNYLPTSREASCFTRARDLVEIDVKGGNPSYVKSQLRRRIEDRGLDVVASSAGGFVYLERKN